MKKKLLLLLTLVVGSLNLWSQDPLCQTLDASPIQSQTDELPMLKRYPEAVNIYGTECRLDKHVIHQNMMDEYVYDGNSVLCNRYAYDWITNDWLHVAKSNSVYTTDGTIALFESFYCPTASKEWIGKAKFVYEYDQEGHTILFEKYLWSDSRNDWYCQMREESLFSDRGMKISSIKWRGTDSSSTLKGTIKTENVLYQDGSVKEKIIYEWGELSKNWVPSTRETFAYNWRGNKIEWLIFDWDEVSGSWEQTEGHQYTYRYGIKARITSCQDIVWDKASDKWEPKYVTSYGYDSKGLKLYHVRAKADSPDPLNGFEKDEYEYNALNQVVLHNYYLRPDDAQDWRLDYRDEYSYDQNGNPNSFVRFKWTEANPEGFGWQKWEREYSDARNVTMRADYKWDNLNKSWVGKDYFHVSKDELGLDLTLKENYTWNGQGWARQSYQAIEFDQDNLVVALREYESDSNQVISQELYYYRPIGTTGITEVLDGVSSEFNIEGSRIYATDQVITVYSIDGKLVNSSLGKVEVPTPGFYIVKIGEKASKVYVK